MEVDGVHGKDRRNPALKTFSGAAHTKFERELPIRGWLELYSAKEMQQAITTHLRRGIGTGAGLCRVNSVSRPAMMCIFVGSIARRARGAREHRKEPGK